MLLHLVILAFCTASASASVPQTLVATVRYAIEHSPTLDVARKHKEARELELQNASGAFLPSLDVSATHGLKETNAVGAGGPAIATTPGAPWSSALTLGVTENLYDNGESLTKYTAAKLKRDLAELEFAKTRDALILNVITQYYQFSLATLKASAKREYRSTLEKQYQQLSRQYLQGFKTKVDFLRFKTRVQSADVKIVAADNAIELARIELRRLVTNGTGEAPSDFDPVRVPADPAVDVPKSPPRREDHYEYRQLVIERSLNDTEVRLARRRWLPEATLGGGVTYANANYVGPSTRFDANDTLSWNVLLTLKYNLWDWGIRKNTVGISEANRDAQNDTLVQSLEDASARSQGVIQTLGSSKASLTLSHEILALEEQNFTNISRDYREGRSTYLDLISGLDNLLSAREDFYSGWFDLLKGLAQYDYYRGTLHETYVSR